MKQSDWKIIYTNYDGIAKRAIHLLSKEAGALLIREPDIYRIYVLPCEKEGCDISKNAFFISLYNDSEVIKSHVAPSEIPANGFLVKVIANPNDPEGRFVILTAHTEQELFYAAVSFLDDYIPKYAPNNGANKMPDRIFDQPLPETSYTEISDHQTRSIFTWGHSINDYRAYIDNMARLKFNELILWNDYVPVNIIDIINYAHSFGIKVVLGYSWGWREIGNKVAEITDESIELVKDIAIRNYRNVYANLPCDGIYFQSFTERSEANVGGKLISRIVVDMVNDIATELWKITPGLRLIFGLHATSVREHLNEIARIDPRMEILWEDCGDFPYCYGSLIIDEEKYDETLKFTKNILELRGGVGVGLVFKGIMMLDWTKAVGQHGPYVMGENDLRIAEHDRRIRASSWRKYSADWIRNGSRVLRILNFIKENKKGEVNLCLAGTFDGGIYLPMALCAQMYRNCNESYEDLLRRVVMRNCITTD